MKNFIRFTSLCGIVLLFPTGNTAAQTSGQCAIAPTCSELGYEQEVTDCSGQYMLKCPFDNSKVFCGGIDCSYTNTSLPSGCSNAPSCTKDGKNYFSAVCSSCYTGYSLKSDGTCSQTCTYSDSSLTGCAGYSSCQRGSANGIYTYYKCTSCSAGYYLSYNHCNSCSDSYNLNGYIAGRTSGPYTEEECVLLREQYSCGGSGTPGTYSCGNKTWYGCAVSNCF